MDAAATSRAAIASSVLLRDARLMVAVTRAFGGSTGRRFAELPGVTGCKDAADVRATLSLGPRLR